MIEHILLGCAIEESTGGYTEMPVDVLVQLILCTCRMNGHSLWVVISGPEVDGPYHKYQVRRVMTRVIQPQVWLAEHELAYRRQSGGASKQTQENA